jgi:hypothetical protein
MVISQVIDVGRFQVVTVKAVEALVAPECVGLPVQLAWTRQDPKVDVQKSSL